METNTFFNCTCTFCSTDTISSTVCFSIFGVVSVTEKYCSTSLVKEVELQAKIPQENKLGVMPKLTRKTTVNFQTKDKYTMRLDVGGCITRIARRFMLKSVPQHS
jgi:hypothetical protein